MSADNCEFLLQNIVVSGQFIVTSHSVQKKNPEILQNVAVFSLWLPLCFVNDTVTVVTTNRNKRLVLSVLLIEFMR